jgi:proline racemase
MQKMWKNSLEILQVHCQGEIGKVIVGGAPDIPGDTVLEQMNYINKVDDSLRRFVAFEPRAHVAMSMNLLVPPKHPFADAGFIVLQADRAHPMSGSNFICVVTALLETGRVQMYEPETIVKVETPAGLITARAACKNGRCLSVSLDNVPCFAEILDQNITTPHWGTIKVDIAFGGVFYALIDADQLGLTIAPRHARELAEAGVALRSIVNSQVKISHPDLAGIDDVAYVMFRSREADGAIRTCTTLKPGRVDRSPCGTGSSANLACLYARGEIKVGDKRISRSTTGGEFTAEAIGETNIGVRRAVLPRITGRAWIYGREELRIDSADPFPLGFTLSDSWGSQVEELT